ncbi:MAG: pyridoxamine 5'-phosphate oxidase family protein [Actinomycetes bacterium]
MYIATGQLDERFSESSATPASWADTQQAIEAAELFWISTVRSDGRPHVTPLVSVWHGDALHFCAGPDEQKTRNLQGNPHVVLTTGCSDWARGVDVVVEGAARRVTHRDTLEHLARAWAEKWDGRWRYLVGDNGFEHEGGGEAWVYAVEPEKVLAFGKGVFSQTRHQPA